jgi:transposase InsO family protein
MLNHEQLKQYYQKLRLPEATQEVINRIRNSPPARRVRSGQGNVTVRYPSRKMGCVIQAESHKNELAGVYEKEYDLETLEYYDQPEAIELVYNSKKGRRVRVSHTPDFFVLKKDGAGWEEWKMEEALLELAEQQPHRYQQDKSGQWRCPAGEAYAKPLGLFYAVRSSAEIDWVLQRNLRFLEDYLRDDCPDVKDEVREDIIRRVCEIPGGTLDELLCEIGEQHSDSIYRLIAINQIYCDLSRVALAEPRRAVVYKNEETAQAYRLMTEAVHLPVAVPSRPVEVVNGTTLIWDNRSWLVVNLGESKTWLRAEDEALVELPNIAFENLVRQGEIVSAGEKIETGLSQAAAEILHQASPKDLQAANQRYQIIAPILNGHKEPAEAVPERTWRRWVQRYRQAEQSWGCGYIGLIPLRTRRGNRVAKIATESQELVVKFIEEQYETLKQKSKRAVYGQLIVAAEEAKVKAPSYPTFCRWVSQRDQYEQTKRRQGERAAYWLEPLYLELKLTTPRHGDRPFEIVHIDHTQLDLELICASTERTLGRPWVTFLMDAFSRRLLAFYLSYDPPSYRSCMMVLRECVRRYGRFPHSVVVDRGSDFESVYFETLLATYECTKKSRPGAKPRFGSVCERLFGTSNTTFVYNLVGNTQATREPRQMTKAVDPRRLAQWTLERIHQRLGEWAYEVYDTIDHPALGQTPRACFAQGLMKSGPRRHRLIAYDQEFQIFTLPTTSKGTAKVQPNIGVKINYIYYWADAFRKSQVEQSQVPVRYDPFDAGIAYAYVKGGWVQCISEHYAIFSGRSEREIMLATAELRQRHRQHGRSFNLTARKLADFLNSLEAEELLYEQRLRDEAAKTIQGSLTLQKGTESQAVYLEQQGRGIGRAGLEIAADDEDQALEAMTMYGDF